MTYRSYADFMIPLLLAAVFYAGQISAPSTVGAKASIWKAPSHERAPGQALRGARISLLKRETNGGVESERVIAPVTTGDSGQFRILGVEPGQYRIAAERDGFIRQEYGQRNPAGKGVQISIVAGQQLTIDFQMLPAGVISGRILDEQGDPLAGATVQAQTYQYVNGKPILVGVPQ